MFNFPYFYPRPHVGTQVNDPGETGPGGIGHTVQPRTNIRLSGTFLMAYYMPEQAHSRAMAPFNNNTAGQINGIDIPGLQKAAK